MHSSYNLNAILLPEEMCHPQYAKNLRRRFDHTWIGDKYLTNTLDIFASPGKDVGSSAYDAVSKATRNKCMQF